MEKQNQSPNPFRLRITLLLLFMGSAGSALGQADVAVTQVVHHHGNEPSMSVFVITVRNNGPEAATNVVVASNLSNDWSFHNPTANHVVSHGALSWSSTDNRNLTWGVPFIPNGGPLF